MSSAVIRTGEGAGPSKPIAGLGGQDWAAPSAVQLMVLAFAVCAFTAVAFARQLLWDGDTLWHLATGQWMLDHRQIVVADPFSFTAPGKPWTNLEWLSEVVMAPVYDAGGLSGVQLLFALALGVLTWILGGELARKLPPFSCAVTLFLALACTSQSWLARPHLLALPVLALWTVQLLKARERGRAPALWLLPVMTVWANLHGSFMLGLALVGPFAAEALCEAPRTDRLRVVRDWGLFGVGALVAALITPYGVMGPVYTLQLMTMRSLPDIVEWRSANFSRIGPLELTLLTTLFVILYRGVKIPIIRLATVLGLLHLALHETRHQMVLAVVGSILLAEPVGRALVGAGPSPRLPPLSNRVRAGALAVMAVTVAVVIAVRLAIPAQLTEGPTAPIAALARVPEALRRQPVLNEYGMGGYLIFNHVRPFIDGRADMYGDEFVQPYMKATKGDAAALRTLISRYHVRWTLLGIDDPAVANMDALKGWSRLYSDKWAVVHVKTEPEAAAPLPDPARTPRG